MSKVTQTNNGDSGALARQNWNEALKEVDFTDMASASYIDDDTMATATDTTFATSESIKAYIDSTTTAVPAIKSYTFKSKSSTGVEYIAGYYQANAADANLTNASTTVAYGTANLAYGAHAFMVSGSAGTTDGSDLVLTVTGTSITSLGVRTAADSEVLCADCTAETTDKYTETSKKWIGQVTYTLSSTGGATFSHDFNYGFAKYDDMGNASFQLTDVEFVGEGGASDSGFNLRVLLHDGTGWTFHATAFVPGGTEICNMNTDYNTETDIANGEYFAYKRTALNYLIDGTGSNGIVFEITNAANNSVDFLDAHAGFLYTSTLIT